MVSPLESFSTRHAAFLDHIAETVISMFASGVETNTSSRIIGV
jgi:hypothetical protein